MLELEDIQHYLLTRPNATIAQYNFITFRTAEGGRNWINALMDTVGTAKTVMNASESDMRWVSLAFTFNGLRKLGVDEASLASFPEPFRQGMAARAAVLGEPRHVLEDGVVVRRVLDRNEDARVHGQASHSRKVWTSSHALSEAITRATR